MLFVYAKEKFFLEFWTQANMWFHHLFVSQGSQNHTANTIQGLHMHLRESYAILQFSKYIIYFIILMKLLYIFIKIPDNTNFKVW